MHDDFEEITHELGMVNDETRISNLVVVWIIWVSSDCPGSLETSEL